MDKKIEEYDNKTIDFLSAFYKKDWTTIEGMIENQDIDKNVIYSYSSLPFYFVEAVKEKQEKYFKISDYSIENDYHFRSSVNINDLSISVPEMLFFVEKFDLFKKLVSKKEDDDWQYYNSQSNIGYLEYYSSTLKSIHFFGINEGFSVSETLDNMMDLGFSCSTIIQNLLIYKYIENGKKSFELKEFYKNKNIEIIFSDHFFHFFMKNGNQKLRDKKLAIEKIFQYIKRDKNEDIFFENVKHLNEKNKLFLFQSIFVNSTLDLSYIDYIANTNNLKEFENDKEIYRRAGKLYNKEFEHFLMEQIKYNKRNIALDKFINYIPDFIDNFSQSIKKKKCKIKNTNQLDFILNYTSIDNIDIENIKNIFERVLERKDKTLLDSFCDLVMYLDNNGYKKEFSYILTEDNLNNLMSNPKLREPFLSFFQKYSLETELNNNSKKIGKSRAKAL